MRIHAMAVLAVVFLSTDIGSLGAAGDDTEEAVKKELQEFKGTWKLISREVDGKKFSEDDIKDVILTHDGTGKISVRRGGKVIVEATTKLDPMTKPKTIDVSFIEGERKGKTVLGIYEIKADTIRVCNARPGDDRPAEFSATVGSGRTLIVYQREKK